MQIIIRRFVACSAIILYFCLELIMIERTGLFPCIGVMAAFAVGGHLGMECISGLSVTSDAIIDDRFVKQVMLKAFH